MNRAGQRGARWLLTSSLIVSFALSPTLASADEAKSYEAMSKEELEEARSDTGLGGPIALLSVGGFLFLIGAPVLLAGAVGSASCNAYDCSAPETVLATGAIIAATGVGMGVGGGLWLGSRIGERRAINRELKSREATTGYLDEVIVDYGLVPTPGGVGLGFGGTF